MMPKIIKRAERLNHCDLLSAKGTKDNGTKDFVPNLAKQLNYSMKKVGNQSSDLANKLRGKKMTK